jgi:hypothetical protein
MTTDPKFLPQFCEECGAECENDIDYEGHGISTCPTTENVLLTCREHPHRPFRVEVHTCEVDDYACTECGYMRTYRPGDELEEL